MGPYCWHVPLNPGRFLSEVTIPTSQTRLRNAPTEQSFDHRMHRSEAASVTRSRVCGLPERTWQQPWTARTIRGSWHIVRDEGPAFRLERPSRYIVRPQCPTRAKPLMHATRGHATHQSERSSRFSAPSERICWLPSSKLSGESHASKLARIAGHSESRIENQAVSRLRPLTMRCR